MQSIVGKRKFSFSPHIPIMVKMKTEDCTRQWVYDFKNKKNHQDKVLLTLVNVHSVFYIRPVRSMSELGMNIVHTTTIYIM